MLVSLCRNVDETRSCHVLSSSMSSGLRSRDFLTCWDSPGFRTRPIGLISLNSGVEDLYKGYLGQTLEDVRKYKNIAESLRLIARRDTTGVWINIPTKTPGVAQLPVLLIDPYRQLGNVGPACRVPNSHVYLSFYRYGSEHWPHPIQTFVFGPQRSLYLCCCSYIDGHDTDVEISEIHTTCAEGTPSIFALVKMSPGASPLSSHP